jgi:NADH-quinone oxidoreductase subunit C
VPENELSLTLRKILDKFGDAVIDARRLDMDTVVVARSAIFDLARFLRDDPELKYNYLTDLTVVDYDKRRPRFEVVYHFFSLDNNTRVRVKVPVGEPDAEVESLTPLWKIANWLEREAWDMFGVRFRNHPDLKRILMYPEFEGHPLRKDYPINRRQPLVGPKDPLA